MHKIGLLINPHAKQTRTNPKLIKRLAAIFPHSDRIWQPKDLDALSDVTKNILDQKIDVLFLSGGDGTFRATVQSFLNHHSVQPLPSFVLLQGGTGGLYSKHYFGKKRADRHLAEVLTKLTEGSEFPTTKVNILKVNDHFGFIFDVGGFSNVLKYYMEHAERSIALANWIISKLAISFFLGTSMYKKMFPPFTIRILEPGKPERNVQVTSLSCSSLSVGYGLRPFYKTKINECFASMIFFKSPYRVFLYLPSLLRQDEIRNQDMEISSSSSLELFLSHPLQPMVDGDILEPTQNIKIELGPEIHLLTL